MSRRSWFSFSAEMMTLPSGVWVVESRVSRFGGIHIKLLERLGEAQPLALAFSWREERADQGRFFEDVRFARGDGRPSSVRSAMFIVPCLIVRAKLRRSGTEPAAAKDRPARRTDPHAAPTELGWDGAALTINMALLTELFCSRCVRMVVHFSPFFTSPSDARREFTRAGLGRMFGTRWNALERVLTIYVIC